MDISELEEEFDLEVKKQTEEGHSHTTFLGKYQGKKAVIKHSEDERTIREKEALKVTENADIRTPEVLDYMEMNGDHILITEMVDHSFPGREKWKDLEFCRKFAKSAAWMLRQIHSEELMEKAVSETEAIPENRDRALDAMKRKNHKIREDVESEAADIAVSIPEKIESEHRFTHGDFSTENILITEDGIQAVIDWAEAGFTSRLRDIALFESSFIDEYISFFHPKKVEEIRVEFRSIVEPYSTEKLELYRFHQNAVVLAFIRRGRCSEEWLKVGTLEEIESHRKKVLEQDINQARKLVTNFLD